ncbi:MAG: Gfo/Idh/MocA family oxidoreductase [Verrucomicrobiales bacterium]
MESTTPTSAQPTRRRFLQSAGAAAFGFQIMPSSAWGANDRVAVGCIGIGGKGAADTAGAAGAGGQIVALCDVDENRRKKGKDSKDKYPDAKFFTDFREMLAAMGDKVDAVTVSTPDHLHCHASVAAMKLGKHVYCQKPLSHSIAEARLMAQVAKEKGVVTQMGNQAHAGEPIRRAVELIRAGVIGPVKEVHAYTDRPIWPQGMKERPKAEPVPDSLKWDLWLGPAPFRDYNPAYCPFKWRGWWDFGTGALGDMACHIMDMAYWALELGAPTSVEAVSEGGTAESGPLWSSITYEFPAAGSRPAMKYFWHDGKKGEGKDAPQNLPPRALWEPSGLDELRLTRKYDCIVVGEKATMFFGRSRTDWMFTPEMKFEEPPKSLPRAPDGNPYKEWIDGIQGKGVPQSNFAYAGPFTEVVLLGNLAVRLGKKIEWDSANLKATNAPEADALIKREYRDGWALPA